MHGDFELIETKGKKKGRILKESLHARPIGTQSKTRKAEASYWWQWI